MTALRRKLLRDLRHAWPQVLSIAAVFGCGVMAALSMRSTLWSVERARSQYYERYRFAHVFARLERAPERVAHDIAAIEGVAAVQTRVTIGATLDVPGLAEPATGQVVSIPARRQAMPNDLFIRRGAYPAADADDEALVSEHFAELNALGVGDTLGAVINGRWQRLRVAGIATSPEYVYEMGAGGFMVDNRRFGVLWMSRDLVARAAGMDGAFNDVAIRLAPGANEASVIDLLDRLLGRYGGRGAFGRRDQPSSNVIDDEMRQLGVIGTVFPLFFLATSAFLLNMVLSRLIATQRDEIAALKAFGYADRAVGAHYLGFALVVVAIGAMLGIAGGHWLGGKYTDLYARVFRFPTLEYRNDWVAAAVAIVVSGVATLLGAVGAVARAVRIPPAEALRPPSPARYHPLLLERLGVGSHVPTAARMVLRTLERTPWRTLASIIGVALAGALVVAGLSPWGSVNRLMSVQFEQIQREDVTVAFTGPRPIRAARELYATPGVTGGEPFRSTAVRLRNAQHVRSTQLLGLDQDGRLRRLIDMHGRRYALPPGGLVLPSGMASALGLRAGDSVIVELMELGGVRRRVPVAATIEEMIGATAYVNRRALNGLLREGDMVSGAYLLVDEGAESAVFASLERMPGVAGTTSRRAMLDHFRRTMAENIAVSVSIVVFAAVVIAVGVVYNQARIALSERGRDLASLRVLGFTRREVRSMLLGEQAVVTLAGIPLGFAIGAAFAALFIELLESERHRFPVVVGADTYAWAAVVIALAAAAAGLAVRRRVDRLDLVAVLKTRE